MKLENASAEAILVFDFVQLHFQLMPKIMAVKNEKDDETDKNPYQ